MSEKETNFNDYLHEQMKDPEFRKEYEKAAISIDLGIEGGDRTVYTRPKGTCKSCKYRDPEDKKCDCGGLERQGCIFPVSDDYFCKYYERGEE